MVSLTACLVGRRSSPSCLTRSEGMCTEALSKLVFNDKNERQGTRVKQAGQHITGLPVAVTNVDEDQDYHIDADMLVRVVGRRRRRGR